jgi:hypothetical protein
VKFEVAGTCFSLYYDSLNPFYSILICCIFTKDKSQQLIHGKIADHKNYGCYASVLLKIFFLYSTASLKAVLKLIKELIIYVIDLVGVITLWNNCIHDIVLAVHWLTHTFFIHPEFQIKQY